MLRAADDFPTFFTPADEFPLIIDCGANIGVSVLEWKYRWPTCRIICFEPDPYAFALLKKNVIKNDLPGVQCFCTAISDQSGEGEFLAKSDMEPIRGEIHCDLNGEIERTLTYLWYVAKDWGLI